MRPYRSGELIEYLVAVSYTHLEETQLRITVKGRRQYPLTKMGFEYGISSGAPTELLGDVSKALAERPWVKDGGYYVPVSYTHLDVYKRQRFYRGLSAGQQLLLQLEQQAT